MDLTYAGHRKDCFLDEMSDMGSGLSASLPLSVNVTMLATYKYNKCFLQDNEELLSRLKRCTNLPSPPGVAARIIELGQDPEVEMDSVAEAVSLDPALTAKLFRIANSPLYGQNRKIENLRQALLLFGLNGTLSLALSFSLVRSYSGENPEGMDYNLFWRRSLAVAICCRTIGSKAGIVPNLTREDLFLSGLLQDIGILALDRVAPRLYKSLEMEHFDHAQVQAVERAALGTDHAEVGAWLLENWHFPAYLVHAVAGSHDLDSASNGGEFAALARCSAVAGVVAEICWHGDLEQSSRNATNMAKKLLGIDGETLNDTLRSVAEELKDTAALFDVNLGDLNRIEHILDQAKEILMFRNLQSVRQSAELQKKTESLRCRARELEQINQRDNLTGLFNRAVLDRVIVEEFKNAKRYDWPLAVVFFDVDHFKRINDTYGHQAGDDILRSTARLLQAHTRDTDIVARYGGEEFVAVLPGTNKQGTRLACERVINAFREAEHDIGSDEKVRITMSAGAALLDTESKFEKSEDLLRAADRALYAAKQRGRNRWVLYYSTLNS